MITVTFHVGLVLLVVVILAEGESKRLSVHSSGCYVTGGPSPDVRSVMSSWHYRYLRCRELDQAVKVANCSGSCQLPGGLQPPVGFKYQIRPVYYHMQVSGVSYSVAVACYCAQVASS